MTKRHMSKKKMSTRKIRAKSKLPWLLWGLLILLLCCVLFFMYRSSATSVFVSKVYSNFTSWVSERHKHLVKKVASSKKTILNQTESQPPIHFEFYTTLPNMQVNNSHLVSKKETVAISKGRMEIVSADELEHDLSNAVKKVR